MGWDKAHLLFSLSQSRRKLGSLFAGYLNLRLLPFFSQFVESLRHVWMEALWQSKFDWLAFRCKSRRRPVCYVYRYHRITSLQVNWWTGKEGGKWKFINWALTGNSGEIRPAKLAELVIRFEPYGNTGISGFADREHFLVEGLASVSSLLHLAAVFIYSPCETFTLECRERQCPSHIFFNLTKSLSQECAFMGFIWNFNIVLAPAPFFFILF